MKRLSQPPPRFGAQAVIGPRVVVGMMVKWRVVGRTGPHRAATCFLSPLESLTTYIRPAYPRLEE